MNRTPGTAPAALRSGATAVVVNLAVFGAARAVVDVHVPANGGGSVPLAWPAVVTATVVGTLLATVAALLARRTRRPRRTFGAFAVTGLLASLGGPLGSPGLDGGDRAALVLMHVTTAAVLVPLLSRVLPVTTRQRDAVATGATA